MNSSNVEGRIGFQESRCLSTVHSVNTLCLSQNFFTVILDH